MGEPCISLGTSGTAYAVTASPASDPSGVVAGFADATGRYLPLAATLNATLAVDRFAAWLGLDRDDAADSSAGVVVAPFLDGERTPNLPEASGAVIGLRHTTAPEQVLRSVYEGVVVSLLDAVERLEGVAADAPLTLIGGGARGRAWREVVQALCGRPVLVPSEQELVAMGAAAQAAALVTGEAPEEVARRWDVAGARSPRGARRPSRRWSVIGRCGSCCWRRCRSSGSVAPWFARTSAPSSRSPGWPAG